MAKSDKALENLKKLYGEQATLNKKILVAEKAYAVELKEEAKAIVKQPKTAKTGKRGPAKKTGAAKAPARRKAIVKA
jgi:hypothetical protein